MRLGIDTGGTCTDAVLLDEGGRVVAAAKAETTRVDLSLGIGRVLDEVLKEGRHEVDLVGLSTTLATNAVVEGRGAGAALVLIGFGPELLARGGLRGALDGAPVIHVGGGHDAHGRETAPFDARELDEALAGLGPNVEALAVCAQFAVRNPAHERAAALVAERTGLPVTLSTSLSARLDAPRRALTALLNARLLPFVAGLLDAVAGLLAARGIAAPLMVVKGDGSLMAAEVARARPVETVLSGPAASVVGACYLTGLQEAVVSDVGGTTTDVAVLRGSRPALRPDGAVVGGRRTMVEAIDMATVGLGGDSRVACDVAGEVALGPERAVPLSLLARLHPEVLAVLAAERARPNPRPMDAAFALAQVPDGHDRGGFNKGQRALLALLEGGPRPLAEIVEREHLEIPLRRLGRRGLVLLAGFTPTDAAHVLGLQDGWDREAAALGAVLEARKAGGGDPRAFAAAVLAEARRRSAAVLLEAVLPEDEPLRALLRPPLRGLARAALEGGRSGDAGMALGLNLPVVAVGGPARLFYPAAAKALGTDLVVPEHFAVCNAVGAVAGEVAGRATMTATRKGEDRLVVHLPERQVETGDLEAVRRLLREAAVAEAERRARAAGAEAVAVEVAEEVQQAVLDGGREMVMEVKVQATARGRPRLGG